jgi:hypothetical protein
MSIHDFIPLITSLITSWPIFILIIALLFRRRINDLIELKIGDKFYARFKVVLFGQDPSDLKTDPTEMLPPPTAKQLSAPSGTKWENVGSVFWLGGDLVWTGQAALRGAPKERILHGLTQAYHHISELGLADSAPGKRIASLKSETESRAEAALDRDWRSVFSQKTWKVTGMITDLLKEKYPYFRPNPQGTSGVTGPTGPAESTGSQRPIGATGPAGSTG